MLRVGLKGSGTLEGTGKQTSKEAEENWQEGLRTEGQPLNSNANARPSSAAAGHLFKIIGRCGSVVER